MFWSHTGSGGLTQAIAGQIIGTLPQTLSKSERFASQATFVMGVELQVAQ
jgi:hypothetical protein